MKHPPLRATAFKRTAVLTAAAVTAALLAAPGTATAQADGVDCTALGESPSAATTEPALEIAVACGVEVLIEAVTTEYDTYSATPEGRIHKVSTAASAEMLQEQGTADPTLTEADGSLVQTASPWDLALGTGGDAPLVSTPAADLFWAGSTPAPAYSGTEVVYDGLAPGLDLTLDARVSALGLRFDVADEAAWNALASGLDLEYWATSGGRLQNTLYLSYPPDRPDRAHTMEQTTPFYLRDSAGMRQDFGLATGSDGMLALTPDGGALGDAVFPLTVTAQWTYQRFGVNEWASVTSAEPDLTLFRGDGGLDEPYFVAAGQDADAIVGTYCDAAADPECAAPAQAASYWDFAGGILGDILPSSAPGGSALSVAEAEFRVDAAEGAECVAPDLEATRAYGPHLSWTDRPVPTGARPAIAGACVDGTAVYDLSSWSVAGAFVGPTYGMTESDELARFDGDSARLDVLLDIEAATFSSRSCRTAPAYPQLSTGTVSYGGFTADLWRPDLVDQGITWTATVRNAATGAVVTTTAPAEVADGTAPASSFDVEDGYYSVRHQFKYPSGALKSSTTCYFVVDDEIPEFVDIEVPPGPHFVGDIVPVQVTVADAGFPNGVSKLTIHCLGDDDCEPETTVLVDDTTFTLNLEIKRAGTTPWMLQMFDQRSLSTFSEEFSITASDNRADYNADGHQDLLAVRKSDGNLMFYAGNGDGTFADGVSRGAGWGGMDIVMADDLTGDGLPDLLARDARTGNLYTYPGNGDGGLSSRVLVGGGWNAMSLFASGGDHDGDGKGDLHAVGDADGKLYFYPGDGDGTFGPREAVGQGWDEIDTMSGFADFGYDGRPDLLVRNQFDHRYYVYSGAGDGSFSGSWPISGDDEVDLASDHYDQITAAGDFDEDGNEDIVSIDATTGELVMHSFKHGGTPLYADRTVETGWGGVRLPGVVDDRAYDFNSDGDSDLLARSGAEEGGLIYQFEGNGTGGFSQVRQTGWGWDSMNLIETAGDFNDDGQADLLARNKSTGALLLYPGDGQGYYYKPITIGGGWNAMSAIVSGQDYNDDGKVDLLARESATGNLWLYPGTGTGSHGTRVLIGTGWNSMSLITAVGDLDHDGIGDVIARKNSDNCLYFYAGKPAGGVKNGVQIGCGWNVMNTIAAVGDFNGDGHVDWVARHTNGSLYLYKGNGAGTYTGSVVIGTGWGGMDIIA
ncbi:hypothetical protein GCM10009830_23160 [Glycomyces endophyticus]|uniref:VCBS repeat-containing protein n=1 Tax=Glycomyces endophyticus TaxID=480996 RepID=A0ABN2GS30_9ACTN